MCPVPSSLRILNDLVIIPVQPQDAYGLEKLSSEEVCKHYGQDFGIEVRLARFHNIYGPYGTWKGGREKAPAAFCRKVSTGSQSPVTPPVKLNYCQHPAPFHYDKRNYSSLFC